MRKGAHRLIRCPGLEHIFHLSVMADATEGENVSKTAQRGWEYEFIEEVDTDFECIVCLLPMREPYLTKCGHCMCKACLDQIRAG